MAQTRLNITTNGMELQISDLNAVSQAAAQADDLAIGELLRMEPLGFVAGGVIARAILPYAIRSALAENIAGLSGHATVISGNATGSVVVNPFRAVIGSRTAVGAGSANQLNWQDVRTQVYVGTNTSAGNGQNFTIVPLAANSSGNPRWDLVYCAMTVDGATSNVTRFVKNPTTKVVSQQSGSISLASTTAVAVVTGTPGAAPALPTIPVDGGGVYYIPLAYVWVPDGFGASSVVPGNNIRDAAPVAPIARSTGAVNMRPANGSNDGAGTYATDAAYQWNTGAGVRPDVFLPPQMLGGESLFVELDYTNAGHPSHADGSIIDSSTDWRRRLFMTWQQVDNGTHKFGNDTTSTGGTVTLPGIGATGGAPGMTFGNSCQYDSTLNSHSASSLTQLGMTVTVTIYVDQSTGYLRVSNPTNSATGRAFVWIMSTGMFPNL